MTAEIAVLNKFGVALAADSAVTVEHYIDGEIKTKVYNTANKLFSLSKYAPVGVMFYNTVTLGGVPWETIIKSYRKKLGRQNFDALEDYANDFFSYLNSGPPIFTDENVRDIIENNFFRELGTLRRRCRNKAAFVANLDKRISQLEGEDYIDGFGGEFGSDAVGKYANQLEVALEYMISKSSYMIGMKRKISRLFELFLTKKSLMRGYAGLVFAGFGEAEALPSLFEYYADIMVSDRVRYWIKRSEHITNTNPSRVVPLADSEAIRTLLEGINPAYRLEMMTGVASLLRSLPQLIISPITELAGC